MWSSLISPWLYLPLVDSAAAGLLQVSITCLIVDVERFSPCADERFSPDRVPLRAEWQGRAERSCRVLLDDGVDLPDGGLLAARGVVVDLAALVSLYLLIQLRMTTSRRGRRTFSTDFRERRTLSHADDSTPAEWK